MKIPLKPIEDQVMVITGASSGIGLCTALRAAERGARLVLIARSAHTLQELASHIRDVGGEAIAVPADVGKRQDMLEAAEMAVLRYGRIDTWVNNAGVAIYGRLSEVSDEDNRRLFDTNFWGVVYGSLAALPHLKRQGGALINVGSEASEAVIPLQGMYAASKHAVKGFTDALRVEVERVDKAPVSITLIQPTAVDTPYPEHARNYMAREPKLPRPMIEPPKVAEAILKAAEEGGRDVKVGALSKVHTTMSALMPHLADRMEALQEGRQQREVPPIQPEGILYRPSESGRIFGRGSAPA
ncbi:SDR family oxidoreductase [Vulcaniibacterium tengchongense]|uniref:Short-subunit dehydrogenase n=1 Tax=Vulcaniibacterium tengchongense TaxID=1273429 RepID=A0A3N4V4C3_9GAMM|nr:SDR family oxidoreductase [Vulcaniibacterium tengchongense]RPE76923.1 short-subunit dehydrogenase [Vulcaniibacterium tengchongense]